MPMYRLRGGGDVVWIDADASQLLDNLHPVDYDVHIRYELTEYKSHKLAHLDFGPLHSRLLLVAGGLGCGSRRGIGSHAWTVFV